jgi:hypothetical protein
LKESPAAQAKRIFEHFVRNSEEIAEFTQNPDKKIAFLYAANTEQRKDFRDHYQEGATTLPTVSGGGQAPLFEQLIKLINAEINNGNLQSDQVRVLPIATISYDKDNLPMDEKTLDEDLALVQQYIQEGYTIYGIPRPEDEIGDCVKATYAIGDGAARHHGFYKNTPITTHNGEKMSFGRYVQLRLQDIENGGLPYQLQQPVLAVAGAPLPIISKKALPPVPVSARKPASLTPPPSPDREVETPPPALESKSDSPTPDKKKEETRRPPVAKSESNAPASPPSPESKSELEHKPAPTPANKPQPAPSPSLKVERGNGVITLTGVKLTAKITGYQDAKATPTLTLSSLNQLKDEKIAETCKTDITNMLDALQQELNKNSGKWKKTDGKFVVEVKGDLNPRAMAELKKIINASAHFIVAEVQPDTLIKPRQRLPMTTPPVAAEASKKEEESASTTPSPRP